MRGEKLKKISIFFIGLLVVSGIIFMIINGNQKQEEPKILSHLEDNGDVNGKREFLFSITNIGTNDATLEFPTWLEYNVAIDNLDNKEILTGEIIMEHIDLNENNKDGRALVLPPNQKADYRLQINEIPSGNYEIFMDSASGYGGMQRMEFKVDN